MRCNLETTWIKQWNWATLAKSTHPSEKEKKLDIRYYDNLINNTSLPQTKRSILCGNIFSFYMWPISVSREKRTGKDWCFASSKPLLVSTADLHNPWGTAATGTSSTVWISACRHENPRSPSMFPDIFSEPLLNLFTNRERSSKEVTLVHSRRSRVKQRWFPDPK
jgi:hypothetical protein